MGEIRQHRVLARLFLTGSCISVLMGCATVGRAPAPRENARSGGLFVPEALPRASQPVYEKSHPSEMRDYKDAEAQYTRDNLEAFQKKAAVFESRNPRSLLTPSLENLWGLSLLKNKKAALSVVHFKKAIDLNPGNTNFNQYILFNLATALWESNQLDEAQQKIEAINPDSLNKSNQLKVCYLKASLYQKKLMPVEAAQQILIASKLYSETELTDNRRNLNKLLDQSLQNISDVPTLEKIYAKYSDAPVADSLLFRLGTQELALGNVGNSEIHFKILTKQFPVSSYLSQSTEMLTQSQVQGNIDTQSIGILLPLKGKLAKYGMKSLQGIELAFDIFNVKAADTHINLVIEDSGDDAEQAINALHRLIFKHHVVAVIGPMLSKGIEQVSLRAQELGVPMLSLARRSGPTQDYVFQAGLTQQLQAYEIARYAIEKLKIHQFAVLYPKDKFGAEMTQSFWDTVEAMGGSVVGAETYNPGETDFRILVDKLSGLYLNEARQRELDQLTLDRETNHITKRTRKTEQFFGLKPIVDYQAVFIPDEAKVAGQILPTFAYRDVEQVKFLGSSSWNSPDFSSRAQTSGDNAFFVDAFSTVASTPLAKSFSDRYRATFSQEASSLEALAYDAGMILRKLLVRPGAKPYSRAELRDQLKAVKDFPGVTGTISYKDGAFSRDLRVLTLKNGQLISAP